MRRPEQWEDDGPAWRMPRAFTLWAPVVISFLVQVPSSLIAARFLGLAPQLAALTIGLALVGPIALAFARRFPGPVVAIVSLAAAVDMFLDIRFGPPYIALAFALLSALVRGARRWAFISITACWIGTITIGLAAGYRWEPWRIAVVTIGILVVVGIGEGMRGRRERFGEIRARRRQQQQEALQAERVRIARELHDVLAHSLSSINVQAGVGLHLLQSRPEQAEASLVAIKETSKSALDEVRAVLGVLRSDDRDAPLVPTADLSRLGELADDSRRGGLEVTLDMPAPASLADVPQAAQTALYRITQEALTNVRRHSGARRVRLTLRRGPGELVLTVVDDGSGRGGAPEGRGLLGMRERAELLGGSLEIADAAPGMRLAARIPVAESPDNAEGVPGTTSGRDAVTTPPAVATAADEAAPPAGQPQETP
ncbi:sensor histidine kinase [Schumannella sp. 10F1B-5-1]|uniref:sensor histidine kinase n=1 Tax=Schumannella sp. 10F1B-5-1 TaxID=2590780 RepID=UPI0011322257|nr:sensor histidine kinase [Schumannella sp. 10F1B-5-1]TPW70819.1 sensor histidine kinase [Schumannella sp. 10F1B-5-1]